MKAPLWFVLAALAGPSALVSASPALALNPAQNPAQTPTPPRAAITSPAQRLLEARKLYYTPSARGLKSLHCNVSVDWKSMLTRFSHQPIADNNPFLVYLNSVQLTATDELSGEGTLSWVDTTQPPSNLASNATAMRNGVVQMIGGFYQSWNQFVNGGMVPAPDNTTTEVDNADGGLHLHGSDKTTTFDEDFDRNMLLVSSHVVMPTLENTAYPTYEASSDGLRVTRVRNRLHQPPTAPEQEVSMAVTYMPVGGFQLPSTLAVTLTGVGEFDFTFSACTLTLNH